MNIQGLSLLTGLQELSWHGVLRDDMLAHPLPDGLAALTNLTSLSVDEPSGLRHNPLQQPEAFPDDFKLISCLTQLKKLHVHIGGIAFPAPPPRGAAAVEAAGTSVSTTFPVLTQLKWQGCTLVVYGWKSPKRSTCPPASVPTALIYMRRLRHLDLHRHADAFPNPAAATQLPSSCWQAWPACQSCSTWDWPICCWMVLQAQLPTQPSLPAAA